MESGRRLIYDLEKSEILSILTSWGEPGYRGNQIWQGIYQNYWYKPDEFSNLSVNSRKKIFENFLFSSLEPVRSIESKDGETQKYLFRLTDGLLIESVLMLYKIRRTICISTQVGCGMGCVFCATGQMGFHRNLTSGEIVEQVIFFARLLAAQGNKITNVVIMGMGEPFLNYDETLRAIHQLNHPEGFNLGARRFSISTVGIVPQIKRFTAENSQVNLAISLHAANNSLRSSLLPVNQKYPLEILIPACREYVRQSNRKITFEWALIDGINDSAQDAQELARLIKPMLCHVNLIPLNPTSKYVGMATPQQKAEAFQAELLKTGIPSTIRLRRGIDVQAGCGQLASS
jgi:23S rRNA (adenine2503-C2)-methyltransferase